MEATQAKEQKEMVAGLKKEQQRELDAFSSNMKQEQSELKKQVAAQFSDRKSRQNTFKSRKTQLDQHQKYKEGAFRTVQTFFDFSVILDGCKYSIIEIGLSHRIPILTVLISTV